MLHGEGGVLIDGKGLCGADGVFNLIVNRLVCGSKGEYIVWEEKKNQLSKTYLSPIQRVPGEHIIILLRERSNMHTLNSAHAL